MTWLAGEIPPLEHGPLEIVPVVSIVKLGIAMRTTVEYAGAAPGQASGVIQINVRLPEDAPDGAVSLLVQTPGSAFFPGVVTVYVAN